jgi:hypothetical protein
MIRRKAQISGLDLIIAIMLFTMAIVLFAALWEMMQYNVKTSADADIIAIQVANRLLNSPGYPMSWTNTSCIGQPCVLGISTERGVIDQSKFLNLTALLNNPATYDQARALLGLGPYQICISMTYPNGTIVQGGNCNFTNGTSISSIKRTPLYGETSVSDNSITFIFDSSLTMGYYSTSVNYTSGTNLSSSWTNIMNATFSSSTPFDFVFETYYANGTQGLYGDMKITAPNGTTYSSSSCPSGCSYTSNVVGVRINFSSARWSAGAWKVYAQKTIAQNVNFDAMAETPLQRVNASSIATNNFINVISNESSQNDEISLFTLSNHSGCPPGCGSSTCANLSVGFTSGNYTNITKAVNGITPDSYTPLAQALMAAANYTNRSAKRSHTMIIILSDGGEDCGGNLSAAATYAMKNLSRIGRICTVGLAEGSIGATELQDAARIGNCKYYSVRNQWELSQALTAIYLENYEKESVVLNIVVWR